MDERTLWRFKTCAITITSPNQQGREGADSEEVWILTGKSVILLNRSSLNHGNGSLFPFKEAYFYACSLPARTSLRISWVLPPLGFPNKLLVPGKAGDISKSISRAGISTMGTLVLSQGHFGLRLLLKALIHQSLQTSIGVPHGLRRGIFGRSGRTCGHGGKHHTDRSIGLPPSMKRECSHMTLWAISPSIDAVGFAFWERSSS